MKTPSTIIIAFLALSVGVGCASESGSSGNAAVPAPPGIACPAPCAPPVSPSATPAPTSGGSTAPLTLTSTSQLARMFYNSNPNNPTNVTVTLNMASPSESVIIRYTDGGAVHEAALGTTHPYSGHSDASYNKWYLDTSTDKQVWKGFFQDTYGAVIIIVDKFLSQGDGQIGNILGGSVWFQNFNRFYPNFGQQGPLKMCWQIEMGPYDCRTWLVGNNVVPASSTYPNNTKGPDQNMYYEKLGDFNGIAKDASGF